MSEEEAKPQASDDNSPKSLGNLSAVKPPGLRTSNGGPHTPLDARDLKEALEEMDIEYFRRKLGLSTRT